MRRTVKKLSAITVLSIFALSFLQTPSRMNSAVAVEKRRTRSVAKKKPSEKVIAPAVLAARRKIESELKQITTPNGFVLHWDWNYGNDHLDIDDSRVSKLVVFLYCGSSKLSFAKAKIRELPIDEAGITSVLLYDMMTKISVNMDYSKQSDSSSHDQWVAKELRRLAEPVLLSKAPFSDGTAESLLSAFEQDFYSGREKPPAKDRIIAICKLQGISPIPSGDDPSTMIRDMILCLAPDLAKGDRATADSPALSNQQPSGSPLDSKIKSDNSIDSSNRYFAQKMNIAADFFDKQNYLEAISIYKRLAVKFSQRPELHFSYGATLEASKDYDRAIEEYKKARDLEPGDEEYKEAYERLLNRGVSER